MKKLNLIIISILLTLTLAACGSPSGPSAPEAAPSGASPTPEQIPAAETPAPDSDITDAGPADTTPAASSPDGEFSNPSLTDSQKEFCEKNYRCRKIERSAGSFRSMQLPSLRGSWGGRAGR